MPIDKVEKNIDPFPFLKVSDLEFQHTYNLNNAVLHRLRTETLQMEMQLRHLEREMYLIRENNRCFLCILIEKIITFIQNIFNPRR